MINIRLLPLYTTKNYTCIILNFVFYSSIAYNGVTLYYCTTSTSMYVGSSLIFAIFSIFSSFILVYGLPFVLNFDIGNILGRLYILVLVDITLLSTLFIFKAPSWAF